MVLNLSGGVSGSGPWLCMRCSEPRLWSCRVMWMDTARNASGSFDVQFWVGVWLFELKKSFTATRFFANFIHSFRSWLLSNKQVLKFCPCSYHSPQGGCNQFGFEGEGIYSERSRNLSKTAWVLNEDHRLPIMLGFSMYLGIVVGTRSIWENILRKTKELLHKEKIQGYIFIKK